MIRGTGCKGIHFRLCHGWSMLLIPVDDGHPDKIVVPLSRVNLFPFSINDRRQNHLGNLRIIDDCQQKTRCSDE